MKKIAFILLLLILPMLVLRPVSAAQEEMNTRIESRVSAAAKEYTQAELDTTVARCLIAQGRISAVRARSERSLRDNSSQYQRLRDYLQGLSQVIPLAELTPVRDTYSTTKTQYDLLTARYLLELSDLVDMDCRANPAGFITSLEAARASRKEIINVGHDLRDQGLGQATEILSKLARPARSTDGE